MIENHNDLKQLAMALSIEDRKKILISYKETELHNYLKELLSRMDPSSLIEITHGPEERGNDLVMVKNDVFRESVVGVVVKSGNIGGKTKGKVDEIKSQVEQSLAHPVMLKAIPDRTFKVSEVWIVIAGILTKAAHERLEKEVKEKSGNIRIDFGIDWLVENFTLFYPQVFFEGKLMDFLAEKILQLEKSVLTFSQRGKNLSECFVKPLLSKIDIPENVDEEKFFIKIEEERFSFDQLNNILKPRTKILLIGDPGVGKTIVLNKYVLDILQEIWSSAVQNNLPEQVKIPIKISAKDFLKIDSYEALIQHFIQNHTDLYNRFKVTIIIIDGLDEVLSDVRNELLEKAKNFSEQLNCSLVVSTRKTDLLRNPPVNFNKCELLPLNYNQALEFYTKLIFDTRILDALREGLESIRYQMVMTPLSLFLLLKIVEARKEVPASITELYDQFSDIILGKYDLERGVNILFEYHIKKRFLAKLAFEEFFEKKRLEISEDEFSLFIKNYANLYGWNEEQLKIFVWEIERAGILNFKGNAISFSHGSFMDYFGAYYIWDNREKIKDLEDFIVQIYFEDSWNDVAFFYIGLQRKIEISLLNKLFEYSQEGITTNAEKFLTGRLLQAGWHSTSDTMYLGIQKAITYAPIIQEDFSKILDKNEKPIPKIYADFLVLLFSDLSFGSRFLLDRGKELIEALEDQPSYENASMMMSLLWAFQRLLSKDDIQKSINSILYVLNGVPKQNIEKKAKILSILMFVGQEDPDFTRILRRKQKQLIQRNPEVFKRLFGSPKQKGFRKKLGPST
ncbi:MAG: AAA family ATPase [Actinomycetia bacterium]|nr:AAA family ATPase [Actinomycetes bacterium]